MTTNVHDTENLPVESSLEALGSESQTTWFIMTTPDPPAIESLLLQENIRREACHSSPIQYFVPYSFLKRRIADTNPEDNAEEGHYFNPKNRADVAANNELRAALKRYIFIKAVPHELESLLNTPEFKDDYRSLWYYRNRDKQRVTVSADVMERFIDACCDKRIQFEVWPAIENIEENDEVVLNITQFKGYKARVLEVQTSRQGEVSLTVGFHLFQGAMLLKLPHLRMQDLLFESKSATAATREANRYKFVEDTQRRLFSILEHRHRPKQSPASRQKDAATLELINTYRYRFFVSPVMRRKFHALMLLCAHLRGDTADSHTLATQVRTDIEEINTQPDGKSAIDLRAFLQAILFITTGDQQSRTAALAYLTAHPKPTETHRKLMEELGEG